MQAVIGALGTSLLNPAHGHLFGTAQGAPF
jgi:hypothetical protein